ncbi:DNA-binding protein [Gracilibacillus caseinilyticus]|uniref:DNA-binding protein n=1 Tax=Gracilibacillus caseinilyticus TaxID=2932256 RepID=A0ABY4EUJ1_9BACI|nr:DNA-binding protein [Gracilibacillus caseinilyticus]UOQ48083.1 DNA-binding protein [Gracilibacillus caseinilyticus]
MMGVLIASLIAMIGYVIGLILTVSISKSNASRIMKHGMILFITGYVLTAILFYFIMPAITVPNMLAANLIIAAVLLPLFLYMIRPGEKKETRVVRPIFFFFTIGLIAMIVVIIAGFTTLDEANQTIIVSEEEQAKPLSKDETPITVAPEFARNKIQKAMSVVPNPQFYDLGKLQVQKIGNDVVYVAPVEFSDFWKFLRGKETAGYFTISATNVNAQPSFHEDSMQYTNSSYFQKYVGRVIYNQYPQYIQSGEAQLEVDEDGKPWYVQTVYRPMSITNKPNLEELKVVIIDPDSGDMKMMDTADAPEFIEGSVSSEMASLENNYFGKYIHGWLNSVFGKKDVKIPNASGSESEVTPVFDENGEMFYFTDLTSPKENIDSALGYTLINARSGELTYYGGEMNNGIMDSEGAKQIVNKEYPEKKWEGYMPVLYNVDGNPTWIVNVLDPNGLHKQYAYIKANDSDFVVFGDTAKETLDAYRMALLQAPGNVGSTGEVETESVSGEVNRVLVTSTEQGQVVQFLLTDNSTIYSVNASKAPMAIFLEQGDRINAEVKVLDNGTATVEEMTIEGLSQ